MDSTSSDTQPLPSGIQSPPTQPHLPVRPQRRAYLPLISIGIVVSLIAFIVVGILFAGLIRKVPITVILDGEAFQHETRAATIADLLEDLAITLDPRDLISLPPETRIEDGIVLQINRVHSLSLTVDGHTSVLWTPFTNPAEILDSAGITVTDLDKVLVDGTSASVAELARWPVPVSRLNVRHAMRLRINDNGETRTIQTTGETVGDALFEAGIPLYLADTISVDVNTPVTEDLEIAIQRAYPVTIIADAVTIETRTQGETIADALVDAGIALMGLDYTIPAEDEPLRADTEIRVVRVKEQVITETEAIPFETVYQADSTLEIDQNGVITEGQTGIRQMITRIRYEDGIEVSRSTNDATTLRPAIDRVITYGTNVVVRTIDTPSGPRSYWRVMRMYITSYSPEALGGDSTTATGRTVEQGIISADTSRFPFGTEIFIPGYGIGLVADTAPSRQNGMWLDLGYTDEQYRHWSRYVDVYILTPVPEQIDYTLP